MTITRILTAATAAALLTTPAWAQPGPPATTPGAAHRPAAPSTGNANDVTAPEAPAATTPVTTPGPEASPGAKAKAYGKRCQGQSKKHVAGEKGTPFSRCVTAMARIATDETDSPRKACKNMAKKHVAGEKGTPFSRCVKAAAQLEEEQEEAEKTASQQ